MRKKFKIIVQVSEETKTYNDQARHVKKPRRKNHRMMSNINRRR